MCHPREATDVRKSNSETFADHVVLGVDSRVVGSYPSGSESDDADALERLVVAVLEIDQILGRLFVVRKGL